MLIRNATDLDVFKECYSIEGNIEKIYQVKEIRTKMICYLMVSILNLMNF